MAANGDQLGLALSEEYAAEFLRCAAFDVCAATPLLRAFKDAPAGSSLRAQLSSPEAAAAVLSGIRCATEKGSVLNFGISKACEYLSLLAKEVPAPFESSLEVITTAIKKTAAAAADALKTQSAPDIRYYIGMICTPLWDVLLLLLQRPWVAPLLVRDEALISATATALRIAADDLPHPFDPLCDLCCTCVGTGCSFFSTLFTRSDVDLSDSAAADIAYCITRAAVAPMPRNDAPVKCPRLSAYHTPLALCTEMLHRGVGGAHIRAAARAYFPVFARAVGHQIPKIKRTALWLIYVCGCSDEAARDAIGAQPGVLAALVAALRAPVTTAVVAAEPLTRLCLTQTERRGTNPATATWCALVASSPDLLEGYAIHLATEASCDSGSCFHHGRMLLRLALSGGPERRAALRRTPLLLTGAAHALRHAVPRRLDCVPLYARALCRLAGCGDGGGSGDAAERAAAAAEVRDGLLQKYPSLLADLQAWLRWREEVASRDDEEGSGSDEAASGSGGGGRAVAGPSDGASSGQAASISPPVSRLLALLLGQQEAAAVPAEPLACAACRRTAQQAAVSQLLRCRGCHAEWYCSERCHRRHWKAHKPVCKVRAAAAAAAEAAAAAAAASAEASGGV